jgi:hypothetical protein
MAHGSRAAKLCFYNSKKLGSRAWNFFRCCMVGVGIYTLTQIAVAPKCSAMLLSNSASKLFLLSVPEIQKYHTAVY